MIHTDPKPKTPETEVFGPTPEDRTAYKELLGELERGGKPGFEPMFNAESVSEGLDQGMLSLPITKGEQHGKHLEERHRLGFAQQRYMAGALGFEVGPDHFSDDGIVSARVDYPDVAKLPERPALQEDGSFLDKDGSRLSALKADAINAARFIASHPDRFQKPGAFQKVFEKIRNDAAAGTVSINPKTFPDDFEGAQAFIRQSTRLMGFEVGDFQVVDGNNAELTVEGTRKGFDSSKTSFFNVTPESLVKDLDRERLRELTEQSRNRKPAPLIGRDVIVSEHDRLQFDLIAQATRRYLEPFIKNDPDWKALERLLAENSHKMHSFAPQEKHSLVSLTYVDGGKGAEVKEIEPSAGNEGGFRIQVPTKVLDTLQWEAMAKVFEDMRDLSSKTTRGYRADVGLGKALLSAPYLINTIQQGVSSERHVQSDEKPDAADSLDLGPRNVAKNMERLKNSGEVGEYLTDFYAAALAQDPRLEEVVINPSDSKEDKVLARIGGFAAHQGKSESGKYEVTLNTGDGWEHFDKLLKSRRTSVEIVAKKLGIDPSRIDSKFFAGLTFLHEMGRIVDYMDNSPDYSEFQQRRQNDMNSLPFPGYAPARLANWFHSSEGQEYWQEHGYAWNARGVASPADLIISQEVAYHALETEANADKFAVHVFQAAGKI
jgi:hypothetical protein